MFWHSPKTTGTIPGPHRAHSATLVDHRLFVFGGGEGTTYFDHLYILDTTTLHWTKPECSGTLPGPRRAHTAVLIGKKIIFFGGGDGNKALNETFTLDTEKLNWESVKAYGSLPVARGYHTSVLLNDKIWSYGGSDGQECFNDLFMFDPQNATWTKKPIKNPLACFAHASSLVGSSLFVSGGHGPSTYLSDLKILNLDPRVESVEITTKPFTGSVPSPRGYHTSTLHDSRLFIFGGYDGKRGYGDVHILDLGIYSFQSPTK